MQKARCNIVIPNRNRNLETVKRSLSSMQPQLGNSVQAVVVDYGSKLNYQQDLVKLVSQFKDVSLILCPVQHQLWNKSRCINMVLKSYPSDFLMVCDMDMIWHPDFVKEQLPKLNSDQSVYYQVGFLSQEESKKNKDFADLDVSFYSDVNATGITVFPTAALMKINGFDEFYHGWGSEDSDVHMRLRHSGCEVVYHNATCYFKHQWHPKNYRTKSSSDPYHSNLERINHSYFSLSRKRNSTKANTIHSWGVLPETSEHAKLAHPDVVVNSSSLKEEVLAALFQMRTMDHGTIVQLKVHQWQESAHKRRLKKALNKKVLETFTMDQVNDLLLEWIIMNNRSASYDYQYTSGKHMELVITIDNKLHNLYSPD